MPILQKDSIAYPKPSGDAFSGTSPSLVNTACLSGKRLAKGKRNEQTEIMAKATDQTNILGISGYQGWPVHPLARPGRVVIQNVVSSTHLCYTALMRRLYVICGTPFSGKTTLAQKLTAKTHCQYVNMDEIMRQRGFDLSQLQPVEEWGRAYHICVERVDALMREGVSIVLDDTNYLKGLRDVFRRLASQHQYAITTIYLRISLPELEKRRKNAFRTKERNTLPDEAFYPIIEQFEVPDESEYPLIYDGTVSVDEWIEQNVLHHLA